MPAPRHSTHTSEDYWSLPEGHRAELIGGTLYNMAPPSRRHQKLSSEIHHLLLSHIKARSGPCDAYYAPFAVNLAADDTTWVEPDILVVCDPSKLSDRGCEGAPDLVVEIASPSDRQRDYAVKMPLYWKAGVREYWIVDPDLGRTTVYPFETAGAVPVVYPFDIPVPVGIFGGDLTITVGALE